MTLTAGDSTPIAIATDNNQPRVQGKFLFAGGKKIYICGVTYGTFRPDSSGNQYPQPDLVEKDFSLMTSNGINAIRTYTVPPRWLLDIAQKHHIWVNIGLPWEGHLAFLEEKRRASDILARVGEGVRACTGHPAILCYSIGNEIPSPIVRWYGPKRIERFLRKLFSTVKAINPGALITYVNYPTTEYLQLPFLDLLCFNVFLEQPEKLEAYIARLQNIAGERPLILTEIGMDSRRNGEETQAKSLDWQIRTAFASGCAGVFAFSWTDEWYRGGFDIEDWDFGLTRRDRSPKPALAAVSQVFSEKPFPGNLSWPSISVVVCSYNGARRIRDCFEGLLRLEYPSFEVIVVDDGSTDDTAEIARNYGFRVISTPNKGLSNARNTGMEAASGEIIAYIDDDAYPDPHWLKYLAAAFLKNTYAGIGGPNIAPSGDGWIADCVANAPGGPVPVLLSDQEAEHIAGCNMAFRNTFLKQIGGFDPRFRTAGDDVDVCWRIQKQGWKLGFSPAAMVWHHRRNSLRIYWRQQVGYGKAEALLERKWPEKYNAAGHTTWSGRLYGKGITEGLGTKQRIYHGAWGSALFQSIYQPAPGFFKSLPLMPEWYLLVIALGLLSILGISWTPLLLAIPLFIFTAVIIFIQAGLSAARASFSNLPPSKVKRVKLYSLTALLHIIQPLARLRGRLENGLTPWRRRGAPGFSFPWLHTYSLWYEQWQPAEERLKALKLALNNNGNVVISGGNFDAWDLEIRGGLLGMVRILMAIEEHGAGKQLVRLRTWPRFSGLGIILIILFAGLGAGAAYSQAWVAGAILGGIGFLVLLRIFYESGLASSSVTILLNTKQGERIS